MALVTVSAVILAPAPWVGAASPGAPLSVHARDDAGVAIVTWSRPASNASAPIKDYVVISHPLGRVCVSKTTTCDVARLDANASYRFTVEAHGAGGTSPVSPPSNVVRIPKAGVNYLQAVDALNDAVATDFVAIDNAIQANPNASLTKVLRELSAAYASFTFTLGAAEWPTNARADVANVIADEKAISTDTVDLYNGSAAAAPAVAAAIQGADNTELEADARVRTDLGLAQVISPPITSAPTEASLGSPVVVHDFTNDELSVTVTQIIDPATAADGSGLPSAGDRFVAIEMSLEDVSGGSITGDANYSTTVEGTDGNTYTAEVGGVQECTNFTLGTFQVEGTDTVTTGCVVFQLPTSVNVETINFSLAPGYLDSGEWSN
jgi:hypothetical protein